MIVTAVICPAAPLLVPGLADRLAGQASDLRRACARAVAALRDVDSVLVVSAARSGDEAGVLLPGDPASAAGLARSDHPIVDPVRLPDGSPEGARPGAGAAEHAGVPPDGGDGARAVDPAARPAATVGTAVGAWLLVHAGISAPTSALQLQAGPGAELRDAGRTGLLVMADGSACHGEHAPGAPDPRSESFDADLVTALRSGDPQVLAGTCGRLDHLAAVLRAESLPALAALAALTAGNGVARADMLHYSAPFGVGYPVAAWYWG